MPFRQFLIVAAAAGLLSCSQSANVAPARTYQIGETVDVGHLAYVVSERQWQNQLGSGTDARLPTNRFFLVKVSVSNLGRSEVIFPNTQLEDEAGMDYPESADGEGVQDWIGNTRQLGPGRRMQGYLLYDVPPKRYKLRVYDEDEKEAEFIDIPLSFDSDVPDLTTGGPLDPSAPLTQAQPKGAPVRK